LKEYSHPEELNRWGSELEDIDRCEEIKRVEILEENQKIKQWDDDLKRYVNNLLSAISGSSVLQDANVISALAEIQHFFRGSISVRDRLLE